MDFSLEDFKILRRTEKQTKGLIFYRELIGGGQFTV